MVAGFSGLLKFIPVTFVQGDLWFQTFEKPNIQISTFLFCGYVNAKLALINNFKTKSYVK